MDLETIIFNIKKYSHYTTDNLVRIEDEYFIKDEKWRKKIGQEQIRVINKYQVDDLDASVRHIVVKILENKFGKQKSDFLIKKDRLTKEKQKELVWKLFDDVTISSRYLSEICPKIPKHLEDIHLKFETYVIVVDGPKKSQILSWLRE